VLMLHRDTTELGDLDGRGHSVRECCEVAFDEACSVTFEQYVVKSTLRSCGPSEVDHLIGEPRKAERISVWKPLTSF